MKYICIKYYESLKVKVLNNFPVNSYDVHFHSVTEGGAKDICIHWLRFFPIKQNKFFSFDKTIFLCV